MKRKSHLTALLPQMVHWRNVSYRLEMDYEDSHTESDGIIEPGRPENRRLKERERQKGPR